MKKRKCAKRQQKKKRKLNSNGSTKIKHARQRRESNNT